MNEEKDFSAEQEIIANMAIEDLSSDIELKAYPVPDLQAEVIELTDATPNEPAFVFHGESERFVFTIFAMPKAHAVLGQVQ